LKNPGYELILFLMRLSQSPLVVRLSGLLTTWSYVIQYAAVAGVYYSDDETLGNAWQRYLADGEGLW